jgi:hypothetical protein
VGVDFTVAKLVDAQVEVTVDTRGLFDIQGKGRIIALVILSATRGGMEPARRGR